MYFLQWKSLYFDQISLKYIPEGPIYDKLALLRVMTWRRTGDMSLPDQWLPNSLKHICVTRLQWVNSGKPGEGPCGSPSPTTWGPWGTPSAAAPGAVLPSTSSIASPTTDAGPTKAAPKHNPLHRHIYSYLCSWIIPRNHLLIVEKGLVVLSVVIKK